MGIEDPAQAHPADAQFFDEHRVDGEIEPEAAELGRNGGAEQAELRHARGELMRVFVAVFERAGYRHHLALDEAADGLDEFFADVGWRAHGTAPSLPVNRIRTSMSRLRPEVPV